MAKNLKLNIKNTQLAEALKLTPPKKPAVKKTTSSEPVPEEAAKSIPKEIETPSIPEPIPSALPETKKQEIQEIEIAAPVKETPARFQEEFSESPKPPIRKLTPPERKPLSLSRRDDQEPRPIRRDLSSSYTPRREGSAFPVKREGGPSFPIKREPGTYPVRREGSSFPVKREGSPFPVRREGGNFPVRTGFRPAGSGFGSQNRSPLPPVKEPPKELPQQQQQYKKHTSHHANTDKDAKSLKKESENRAFDVRDRQGLREGDEERWRKRKSIKTRSEQQDETIRPKTLKIRLPISIKDLAAEMKLKASQLIAKLFMQGLVLTLNDFLDDETTVQLLGTEFDCDISIDTSEQERIQITGKTVREEILEANPAGLRLRPPVVAFMGHVDHGKTSLIDSIRKSNVADSEAGAITQHIGAFTCKTPVGTITVLDTPGHEAFSSMRERGAEVTDIAVLVIAGDEGIKAQTLEAIRQAKDAGVCLVVALNKCDKPNFDAETVYRQLADQDLLPEAWGGTVITVNCSAVTGEGIKELLEMLALQAEILELKADPEARARGSVIESELHKGLGPVATVLIQNGTLHPGDALVFDECYARVKTMFDEHEQELSEAGPSTPVKITGLSGIPPAGSEFIVVKNEKEAREIAEKRVGQRHHLLLQAKKGSLESFLQSKAEASSRKILKVIVKADVQGSLEALKTSLRKLPSEKVEIVFVSEGVGEVSESDIQFAATSKAVIIGFHTGIESHAEPLMKQLKVDVRLHDIIYRAVDDIKALMLDLLDKIAKENDLGEAIVKAVFKSSQIGSIAGCSVSKGIIRRNCHARVVRNNEVIWKGPIASLKRVKEDVKEVSKGLECGILLQGFHDYKEEDRIEAFEITYLQQELT